MGYPAWIVALEKMPKTQAIGGVVGGIVAFSFVLYAVTPRGDFLQNSA